MATRRRFLRNCSALTATAALVPTSVLGAPRRWRDVPLSELSFGHFAALVGSKFVARDASGDGRILELILAEPSEGPGEHFTLIFRGDGTQPLVQNTYAFEHAGVGRFEMFIVPIGHEDGSQCYYEAVFNRLPAGSFQSVPTPTRVLSLPRLRTKQK